MLLLLFSPLFIPLIYLDPGTGSFLIQMLLVVLLGAGVLIRVFWSRIKQLFTKSKPGEMDAEGQDDDDK